MLSVYLLIQQLQISSSQFTYQNELFWSIYFKSFFKSAILFWKNKQTNCQASKKIFSTVSTLSIPGVSSYFWRYEMTQCLIRHANSLKAILYLFADFSVLHVLCYWCQWKDRSEEAVIFISFMQSCTRAPLWTHVTILSTSVNIRIHKIHKGLSCQHTVCTFVFSCCCLKRSKFFHWGMSAFYSLGA